jgi:predicted membrane protein
MPDTTFVFPNDPQVTWSIMIVLYPYLSGLVAGTFVVSAFYYGLHFEVLKPVARLALTTSLCFSLFATLPLLLHLHHPERAFNVVITPSATSAMAVFGFVYSVYMLLLTVEIWLVFRPSIVERANSRRGAAKLFYRALSLSVQNSDGGRAVDAKVVRLLALLGIPVACLLSGYVGFLFRAIKGNPWWSTSLMPVIFLVSAMASGIAALVVLYIMICWCRGVVPDARCVRSLCRCLWIFLVVAVSLELLDIGHMAYESGSQWGVIATLLKEHLAVSYGLVQLVIGSIVPFFLLLAAFLPKFKPRLMTVLGGTAALLVLVQVFAMRWNVVVGGQLFSKSFRGFVEYSVPWTGREGLIAAGVVLLLPLLTLWAAANVLPLWDGSNVSKSLHD